MRELCILILQSVVLTFTQDEDTSMVIGYNDPAMILCYQHGIVHSSQSMMTLQILFSYLLCVCFGQKLSSDSRSSVDSMAACVSESQSLCQHEHQQQQQLTKDALKQVTTWTQSAASGLESRGQELDVFLKQELREDVPTGMGSQTQVRAGCLPQAGVERGCAHRYGVPELGWSWTFTSSRR